MPLNQISNNFFYRIMIYWELGLVRLFGLMPYQLFLGYLMLNSVYTYIIYDS